jgi:hypothetical protein
VLMFNSLGNPVDRTMRLLYSGVPRPEAELMIGYEELFKDFGYKGRRLIGL